MTWFRVDDNLCGHKKPRRAGLSAMGLWTIAGSYSSQQGLGGFIPEWYVQTWPSGVKLAAKLVEVGLWTPSQHDGDAGWEFHDWEQCNPSREKVEQDKESARNRMRAKRSSERDESSDDVRANTQRTGGECSDDVLAGTHTGAPAARPVPALPAPKTIPPDTNPDFDRFWAAYPLHVGRGAAVKAFEKAQRKVAVEVLIAGAMRFRNDPNREQGFTPHGSTWLNAERWDDDPLPSRAPVLRAVAGNTANPNKEWS